MRACKIKTIRKRTSYCCNLKYKQPNHLIIPKTDTKTVSKINAAIKAAYKEGEAKLKGNSKTVPALSLIKTPLRDGDAERPDDEAYKNTYFVNANATSAPGIVDADLNPILTRSEVYSGLYGRASITFYAFNSSGNKGIACGLNNLQKIRATKHSRRLLRVSIPIGFSHQLRPSGEIIEIAEDDGFQSLSGFLIS